MSDPGVLTRIMELADEYARAVADTPHCPTRLERMLATERIERARDTLTAYAAQVTAKWAEAARPVDPSAAQETWLPIETAPKDGTTVLLLVADGEHNLQDEDPGITIGSFGVEGGPEEDPTWHFAGWSWYQDYYCRGTGTPTHWQPLPAPPQETKT